MAKVNLSQAAKLAGKNRTTIWRHINGGKLSIERDRDGLPLVETSELIRVYGDLKPDATHSKEKIQHQATPSYLELVRIIETLRVEQKEMKEQISDLSKRLTYKPEDKNKAPEDDPEWPKEVKSLSDINLRQEIKEKYNY